MRRLAITRIVVCIILILCSLTENASALAWLPAATRLPFGLIDLIPETFSRDPRIWTLVDIVVPLALLIALIGYRTRISLLIGATGYLIETGLLRAHNLFYNPGLVPLQMAIMLVLTPCGDTLSLDAYWKRTHRKSEDVYRWAVIVAWMPLALTYTMAGLNKLRFGGLDWFAPTTLRGFVAQNQFRVPMVAIDASSWLNSVPDPIWSLLAVGAVFTEVGYVSVLISKRCRWIFPVLAAGMHIGIWILIGAQFPDLVLVQLAVFPLEELWSYVTKSWPSVSRRSLSSAG